MEAFYCRNTISYNYTKENNILNKNEIVLKNKLLLSPVSGVVKKIDSYNAEIIIKTYDGYMLFLYLNHEEIIKDNIECFVTEGSLLFKGDVIFKIDCGYENADIVILKIKN